MAKPNITVTVNPSSGSVPLQVIGTVVSIPTVEKVDSIAIAHLGFTTSIKLSDSYSLAHLGYQFITYEYEYYWKVKGQQFDEGVLSYTFDSPGTHYIYLYLIENSTTEYVYEYKIVVGINERGDDSPIDLLLETDRQCHRFATAQDTGIGWSKFEGENWLWPDNKNSYFTFFKDGDQISLIYDRVSGLPYIVDSRKPEGILTEVFKDKENLKDSTSGYEIESDFLPAELAAANEGWMIKPSDLQVFFRETPDNFECNLELYVDGTQQGELENIPFNRLLYFIDGLDKEGNKLRLHFYLNKSNYVFEKYIWSLIRTIKALTDDVSLLETEDIQYNWGNLTGWLTKYDYSKNKVNYAEDELRTFSVTDGADGENDSGITSPILNVSLYTGNPSIFFWSTALEEDLFDVAFDHTLVTWYTDFEVTQWILYEIKDWTATAIYFKVGYKYFDFRFLTKDTIAQADVDYMVDEVINGKTDALWP